MRERVIADSLNEIIYNYKNKSNLYSLTSFTKLWVFINIYIGIHELHIISIKLINKWHAIFSSFFILYAYLN